MSAAFGPTEPPFPRVPYASWDGTKSRHVDPTGMSFRASLQPAMTPATLKVAGCPVR